MFSHSFLIVLKLKSMTMFKEELFAFLFSAQTNLLQITGWLLWSTKVNISNLMCNLAFSYYMQNAIFCLLFKPNFLLKENDIHKEQFLKNVFSFFVCFSFAKDHNCAGKARQWNIWFWHSGKHHSLKWSIHCMDHCPAFKYLIPQSF